MNQYTPARVDAQGDKRLGIRDLVAVVFRRRWIVLGVAIPFLFFGIYGTATTTDTFTAESQVLIQARPIGDPRFGRTSVDYDLTMSTSAEIAQSIPVAEKAALALTDSLPALRSTDPDLAGLETTEDLRDLILSRINCDQISESNILGITFNHGNRQLALMVVGAVTEAYIEYNIESRQNLSAIEYYTEQITVLETEIDELMAQRVTVFNEGGLGASQVNISAGIHQMRGLERSYYSTVADRQGVENKFKATMAAIASNPDYIPTMKSSEKTSIAWARNALDQALVELERLRTSYHDSSQFVIRQKDFVARSRRIFEQQRNSILQDLRVELDVLVAKEQSLKKSLDTYREELTAYPDLEREIHAIELQIDTQKDLLETLQLKRGEVRLQAESDQRISSITSLNQPTVGLAVGGGKKMIYLVLTSILGIALGLVMALIIDSQDHRIYDRRQAESVLGVPVLGAISPAEVPESKR